MKGEIDEKVGDRNQPEGPVQSTAADGVPDSAPPVEGRRIPVWETSASTPAPGTSPIADELSERAQEPPDASLEAVLESGQVHPLVKRALVEAKLRADQAEDLMLRKVAEAENLKKRLLREQEEHIKYANESLLLELLRVLDSLERCLVHTRDDGGAAELRKGVELTTSQFHQALQSVGVQPVEAEPGLPFDPRVHEAMFRDEQSDLPANTIAQVLESGFMYNGRLLRPARVAVAVARK